MAIPDLGALKGQTARREQATAAREQAREAMAARAERIAALPSMDTHVQYVNDCEPRYDPEGGVVVLHFRFTGPEMKSEPVAIAMPVEAFAEMAGIAPQVLAIHAQKLARDMNAIAKMAGEGEGQGPPEDPALAAARAARDGA